MPHKNTPRQVRIALIQGREQGKPIADLDYTIARIHEAAASSAQIVCTQELFNTPYFCRTQDTAFFDLAEPVPGATTELLEGVAGELGIVIIASLFERRASGIYHNTAAVIDADGRYLGKYRKMHIPQDPGFEEKFYFTPGDLGYKVWDTKLVKSPSLFAGINGIPRPLDSLPSLGPRSFFIRPPSVGSLRKKLNSALLSTQHGRLFSAVMLWLMAVTSRRSIALASRGKLNSGDKVSFLISTGRLSHAPL